MSYKNPNNNYQSLISSTFNENYNGWEYMGPSSIVGLELESGRLRVNPKNAYNGVKIIVGENISAGENITISLDFDKDDGINDGTDIVRLVLKEIDQNNNSVRWTALNSNIQTGSYNYNYTVVNPNVKLFLRLDKAPTSNDVGTLTHFYIDNVFMQAGALEIIEENNFYPFGLKQKGYNNNVSANSNSVASRFKYNGIEYEEALGLNLYEMPFRQYDRAIGRFTSIDALAEEAFDTTPYRFGFNNPIFFSDPTGLWEEVDGGYSTTDQDEIARLFGYLNYRGNVDSSTNGIMNFIKEDIAFQKDIDRALPLSTAIVKGGSITDHSVHRMKNEIAYYNGTTDYLYTREDYEMRNKILSGGSDPISNLLLDWEKTGAYQPITAKNYINYVGGETTAKLLTVNSFINMMGSVSGGPVGVSRVVTPRYLSPKSNQGSLASKQNFSSSISGASMSITPSFKNMSWTQFRQQYSHLYIGKFKGSGSYMKFMSMDFKAIKAGLRD